MSDEHLDRRYIEQLRGEVSSHRGEAERVGGQIASLETQRRAHEATANAAEELLMHIEAKPERAA